MRNFFSVTFIAMVLLLAIHSNGLAYESLELESSSYNYEEKFEGVMHRPFVKEPTAVIMVEKDSVVPKGD